MVLRSTLEQSLLRTSLAGLSASLPLINRYPYASSQLMYTTAANRSMLQVFMRCGQAAHHVLIVTKVLCVSGSRGRHMLDERTHE